MVFRWRKKKIYPASFEMRQKQGRNCAGVVLHRRSWVVTPPVPAVLWVGKLEVSSWISPLFNHQLSNRSHSHLQTIESHRTCKLQKKTRRESNPQPSCLWFHSGSHCSSVSPRILGKDLQFFSPPPHSRIHFLPTLLCAQSDINLDFCPRLRMPFTSSRLFSGFCFCCQLTAAALSQERRTDCACS